MRILQITESLEVGGAERVVVVLANALARAHEIGVVCVKTEGALRADLSPGIQVWCLGQPEGNDPRLPGRLAEILRTFRPDAIHTHDWGVFLDSAVAARLARVPVSVHTAHGEYMAYPPGVVSRLKKASRHWLERRAARRTRMVCVSAELVQHIVREIGIAKERIRVVLNGVQVAGHPCRGEPRSAGPVRFVTVGRLAAVKNVELLLRAFAQLIERNGQVRLQIVGDGPERARLEALADALRLHEHVSFSGFRSDIDAVLAGSDVFVLSSRSEGIPMSILEAMRAALPIVATRVGGVPATVADGETGLLVESNDVASLARALGSMASDPTAARAMGRAGFDRLRAHFSIDTMVAEYERLYGGGELASSCGA